MNDDVVYITNVRYQMELRGGGDLWRIVGEAHNHPDIKPGETWPSTPVEYDPATDRFKTASGRVYQIESYVDKDKFVEQIQKDIANEGFEVH